MLQGINMISNPAKTPHISIVTPVYGCRDCLDTLYQQLVASLEKITPDFEIIMVNDASPDRAWETIVEFSRCDERVKGINFSRNFGQHYALSAGLHHAAGDWVVVMDCDLQDSPEEIGKLYAKAQEGFDVVFGKRVLRQDNPLKKLGSRFFWATYDYFTEQKSDHSVANFSIISRKVVDEYRKFSEQSRTYVLSIRWLGFKTVHIPIDHGQRETGKSSYTLRKLLRLAFEGIVSHSNKPLRLSIGFGFGMAFLAILFAGKLVYDFAFLSKPVAGWTSVMVSIYFLSGMLMANMGLLGVYLGKIFNETKGRPIYVIQDRVGFTDADWHSSDINSVAVTPYFGKHPVEHRNDKSG
jgi:polyisoprenyl-phosphate glycosyltransferase